MATTVQFVDFEYYLTDGDSGNVLLDINAGVYGIARDTFKPRPGTLAKSFAKSPLTDYSKHVSGVDKLENVTVPLSVWVSGSDWEDDVDSLLQELRRDKIYLLYRKPDGTAPDDNRYYICSPCVQPDTDFSWSKVARLREKALITCELESEAPKGPWTELDVEAAHFVGGEYKTPVGITVLPGEILGNRPAMCDVYISKTYESPAGSGWTNLVLGERRWFHEDWDPVVEPDAGTEEVDTTRRSGVYRVFAASANGMDDPNFNDYTGGENVEVWDHWGVYRTGGLWDYLKADTVDYYDGTACMKMGMSGTDPNQYVNWNNYAYSDAIAYTTASVYYFSLIAEAYNLGNNMRVTAEIYGMAGATLLGKKTLFKTYTLSGSWKEYAMYLYPGDLPGATTTLKVYLTLEAFNAQYANRSVRFGLVTLTELGVRAIEAFYPVNAHVGVFLPTFGATFGDTTAKSNLTLRSNMQTVEGDEISPETAPLTASLGDPDQDWKEGVCLTDRVSSLTIPTHPISENASRELVEQVIRLSTDPLNEEDLWYDHIGLIPIDRSLVEVSAWNPDDEYLIFDSHSGHTLKSLDGSLSFAQILDPTKAAGTPRFVADPNGMNFTLVVVNDNEGNHELTPNVDMTLRYRPVWEK